MAYSDVDLFSSFAGNDVADTFALTFRFMPGETSTIKAALFDVTDPANPVEQTAPVQDGVGTYDYTLVETADPGNTDFTTAEATTNNPIPTDFTLYFYRESQVTSPVLYIDPRFPYKTSQANKDRMYQAVQENRQSLINSGIFNTYLDGTDPNSPLYQLVEDVLDSISGTIGGWTPVVTSAAATVLSAPGEVHLLNTADAVTIELPVTPTLGSEVAINDTTGNYANKTIDANGSAITGKGAGLAPSYTLQSEYESNTLVYTSIGWVII